MLNLSISQAIFDGSTLRARSANFRDEWSETAISLCRAMGSPSAEVECPEALFARPFGKEHVAVVSVAGPPTYTALRFRVLVLSTDLYFHLHDPFAIAGRYPPDWDARGSLPDFDWPPEPLPRRTIKMLSQVLQEGDGPFLLGAAQTLVDGGKIVLQRQGPANEVLRDLWLLLPDSVRRTLWPATFAFSNDLGFDLLAMPNTPAILGPGSLTEDQVRDYPDSRYERYLQIAIETNDQAELDRLLARKSTSDMIRLALFIIVIASTVLALTKVISAIN
ncbi:MAG: hypothetical protein K8T89_13695 [Planctomycetes bacterium]|nr:hypothetical protein [Planctomycetota bacterium]